MKRFLFAFQYICLAAFVLLAGSASAANAVIKVSCPSVNDLGVFHEGDKERAER